MGIYFFSRSSFDKNSSQEIEKLKSKLKRNPDPRNFKILSYYYRNDFLLLEVLYPNCTNFEGKKLLLFNKGVTLKQIEDQGVIDPHFSENKYFISPIARFEPTDFGLHLALKTMLS